MITATHSSLLCKHVRPKVAYIHVPLGVKSLITTSIERTN
jgi:hypothetical protein